MESNNKTKSRINLTSITLLLKITLLVIAIQLMIKFLPLPKLMQVLTPKKRKESISQEEINRITHFTNLILNRRFFIFHPTCLKRSLVLYHFLNKYGLNVVMNFGVKKNNDRLDGHGWLTLDGKPFLENYDPHDTFTVTYSYPQKTS